jgi:hypothetical protein
MAAVGMAAGVARAAVEAEPIPDDFIKQFGLHTVQLFKEQFPTPPVKVDLDADKIQGVHVPDTMAVAVMPDKGLGEKTVAESKDKKAPLGVLLTMALSVEKDGVVVSGDKLATLEVVGLGKAPTFFMDVKGDKEEGRTLELFSKKSDEPVLTMPLTKKDGASKSALTVKLTNIDPEKKKAEAVFSVPGGYEANVKLGFVTP